MNKIGITKKIDSLGRLVIPKEMRILFDLTKEAELIITSEGILIRAPKKEKGVCKKHTPFLQINCILTA